jgi:heterodisulfide reductase subunit C
MLSLRKTVLLNSGQDVRRCRTCAVCSETFDPEQDISLETLVQMIIFDDDEVLTSRTLWSDQVLANARKACTGGIDLEKVMLALREEAKQRGVL